MLENKKILITGAAGSIGSELYRQLAETNALLAVDINETDLFDLHEDYRQKGYPVEFRIGDVRDSETVWEIFDWEPDVVFNCAALKHVYPNELFPEEAIKTNILGATNLIKEAKRRGVETFVQVSTDKAINSYSVMGVTKKMGELVARNAGYVAVRFGNVMHSRGSVLEIWDRQVARGEPITITNPNAERYLMSIPDACRLLIKAAEIGRPGDVLIMNMGQRIRIDDLAEREHPGHPQNIIGLRSGEALVEELMTSEEASVAVRNGDFWIIPKV